MGPGLWAQTEPHRPLPYQEQVYVQLNQELFLGGDTVWAGVIVLEAETLTPSQLSKVAYLEIWAEGAAVIKRRVILEESAAMVAIPLPSDLRSGMYLVRAYTRWMRNGPEAMFFRHWIRVVNPQSPPAVKESGQELFPLSVEMTLEGGQIIASQQHSLHIRATSWDASPAVTDGFLVAGVTDTIHSFRLDDNGYRKLEFAAQPNTDYQLIVKTTKEGYQSIPVGTSTSTGIGMRIVQEGGDRYLQIVGGEEQLRYDATVSIIERGSVRTTPTMSFRSDEGRRIRLEELALDNGVSQFILRNGKGESVGSCFWLEKKEIQPEIDPEAVIAAFTIITSRRIGRNPVGMSEYNWFLAGLSGIVPSHQKQLDHLEEWLPFEANQEIDYNNMGSEAPLIKAESNGIILEGTVKDTRGNAVVGETVYLAFPGDIAWLHLAVTDSNGLFHFVLEPTIGQPVSTIIRGGKTFNSEWTIALNSGFAKSLKQIDWPSLVIEPETLNQLRAYYQTQQLMTTYLVEHELNTSEGMSVETPIYGQPDFSYRFADYTTMPTEEAFIEFIPQAYIRKPNKVKTIYLLNTNRQELFPGPPLLMIDGVPVVNSAEIFAVNYRLVDRIELVTQPYVLNGKFINGILNLITYQKDASSVVLREGELRAELLIVPGSSSAGNQLLRGDHVPNFDQVNEIRQRTSSDPTESMSSPESIFPTTIWVQSVNR